MSVNLSITPEQRYRNAVTKARRISGRNLSAFIAGERPDSGPPGLVVERRAIIAELARLQDALARTTEDLARAIADGSGSVALQAITEERAAIREQINQTKGGIK